MAVKIRMKMMGSKKRPFYRIIAADERSPRDGRFIETIGYYNPMSDPPEIKLDEDKVYKWLDVGAKPTANAMQVLKKAGLLERWQLLKSGVKIHELDSTIEARRQKQPRPMPKSEKEPSEKKTAASDAEITEEVEAGSEAPGDEGAKLEGSAETGEELKSEEKTGASREKKKEAKPAKPESEAEAPSEESIGEGEAKGE
ncbi:MAG: 30S ribosomal protein S16 [bacterium]|nr:MAG: 30S ribosomal protein S16 [bacterium]